MALPIRKDIIAYIPPELALLVLSYLDVPSLNACAQVSRAWRISALTDSLFTPFVLEALSQHLSTGCTLTKHDDLLDEFGNLSASGYFDNPTSYRDAATRAWNLEESWKKGIPSKAVDLNEARTVHQSEILALAVDRKGRQIVTTDGDGILACWDARDGKCTQKLTIPRDYDGLRTPVALALDGDVLVVSGIVDITIAQGTLYIYRRGADGQFSKEQQHSVLRRITALLLVNNGTILVVGLKTGDIVIYGIENGPTGLKRMKTFQHPAEMQAVLTMHYYKPWLYVTTENSNTVKQYAPQMPDDLNLDLWEYDCEIVVGLASGPPTRTRAQDPCLVAPNGTKGELIVSWSNGATYKLCEGEEDCFWNPGVEVLLPPDIPGHHALASRHGYFTYASRDSIVLCDDAGQLKRRFPMDEIGCSVVPRGLVMDPAFIAAACDDGQLLVYFFDPAVAPKHVTEQYPQKHNMMTRGLEFRSDSQSTETSSSTVASLIMVQWFRDLEITRTEKGYKYEKMATGRRREQTPIVDHPTSYWESTVNHRPLDHVHNQEGLAI